MRRALHLAVIATVTLWVIFASAQQAQQSPSGQASSSGQAQPGPASIGEVQGADATVRGAVTVGATGTVVMSGSQVTAGANPATIKLTRGGELKVCAGASITITSSANGHEALIGLNNGTIETRYPLASSADTIVTPDFRLLLAGPGDFHFAIGLKNLGDMCVKSLPGNSSSLIVNEVFGDGTHQVRAGESVLFQKGSVQDSIALPAGAASGNASANGSANDDCGCPPVKTELGFPEQQSKLAAAAIAAGEPPPPPTASLPGVTTKKDEVITKVDAPIVFRGEDLRRDDLPKQAAEVAPAQPATAAETKTLPPPEPAKKAELGPAPAPPPKPVKKKWYQKLGSALASIFH